MKKSIFFLFIVFIYGISFSQSEDEKTIDTEKELIVKNSPQNNDTFLMNPLAPAKAAFYSAILPGLGQAYNKKYWLIPVIYGGMGGSLYVYSDNNSKYNEFVTAYKLELAGKPHQFDNLDKTALERGINGYKKQRDLWLFITIGIYILNVVEANVDAHLPNKKFNNNLSYKPSLTIDPITKNVNLGASLTFNF